MAKTLNAIRRPVFVYTMPDWSRPRDDQTTDMVARRTAPVLSRHRRTSYLPREVRKHQRPSRLRPALSNCSYKVRTVARRACDEGYLQPLLTSFAPDGPARLILIRDNETCPRRDESSHKGITSHFLVNASFVECRLLRRRLTALIVFPKLRHAFLLFQIRFRICDRPSPEKGDFDPERKLSPNSFADSVLRHDVRQGVCAQLVYAIESPFTIIVVQQ